MDARELRSALDDLGLTDGEAARLLYITPNVLMGYLDARRKIPGPLVAAVEGWQRHGPPPGARLISEHAKPGTIKLMRELRDALAGEPAEPAAKPRKPRSKKPGSS
jgi:hypothetical protein